ncbi:hypothetical protein EDB80DRAFT_577251, partial [Ilyonectria destructans]
PLVIFEDLGLLVKFGEDPFVTIAEGQCHWALRRLLPPVPVPEIYGWIQGGHFKFLYMEFVPRVTLKKRWNSLAQTEKERVCEQLKTIIIEFQTLSRTK